MNEFLRKKQDELSAHLTEDVDDENLKRAMVDAIHAGFTNAVGLLYPARKTLNFILHLHTEGLLTERCEVEAMIGVVKGTLEKIGEGEE